MFCLPKKLMWLTGQRIQAYSEVPEQPGTLGSPLLYNPVYFHLVSSTSILGIKRVSDNTKYFGYFYYSSYYIKQYNYYMSLFSSYPDSSNAKQIIKRYNICYMVVYLDGNNITLWHSQGVRKSIFLSNINTTLYKVYENNKYEVYFSN